MASNRAAVWETVRTVIYAVLFAVGLRTFAYEPFSIPSGSMIPTLYIGDFLFVSKFSYGYSRYSFPLSMPLFEGRILASAPERGDVVVFRSPIATHEDWIKRLVGLPGDRIQVRGGTLYINDQPVKKELLSGSERTDIRQRGGTIFVDGRPMMSEDESILRRTIAPAGAIRDVAQYRETLPNGRSYIVVEVEGNESRVDNTPVFEVPAGHYFAMGDNRDGSQDSRYGAVGFIPFENLVGRAEFLFYSRNLQDSFWEIWKIRFERIFQGID